MTYTRICECVHMVMYIGYNLLHRIPITYVMTTPGHTVAENQLLTNHN